MNRRIGFLAVFLGLLQSGFAQQSAGIDSIYNTNSPLFPTAERIAYYEQLYRYRITRFVDLKERQNAGFSSTKSTVGGLVIDLINLNKVVPFSGAFGDPADFENVMTNNEAMVLGDNFAESDLVTSNSGYWSATESYQAQEKVKVKITNAQGITEDEVFTATQPNTGQDPQSSGTMWGDSGPLHAKLDKTAVVGIELVEDAIFDKRKSRLTYDILAIGIVVSDPQSGAISTRFYIKYADLAVQVEKLMRSPRAAERASVMWQNRYNPAENKKFTDAFKLRLFHGVITKVENPDDQLIMETIYNKSAGKGSHAEGVFAMWEKEMELMEKEHNLWEY